MSIQAMKMALEALEVVANYGGVACVMTPDGEVSLRPAITAFRAAIEAAEKVEPVAEVSMPHFDNRDWFEIHLFQSVEKFHHGQKLYTTPQPAIPAGYALVPEKITGKMIDSMNSVKTNPFWTYQDAYKAMLAAAQKEMK